MPPAPRERLALELAASLGAALQERDLGAALVAHEALGKLLAGALNEPAPVVELASRRTSVSEQLELDFLAVAASVPSRPGTGGPGLHRARPRAEVAQLVAGAEPRGPRGGR